MRRTLIFLKKTGVILFSLMLAGCSAFFPSDPSGIHRVDAQLREFYTTSGGEAFYGPAISEVAVQDYLRCQFMENARLCVNTNMRGPEKYSLSLLGRQLGIPWNTDIPADAVFYDFSVKRQEWGDSMTGKPIGPVLYNYQAGRIEQYFERVGMYHGFDEPAGVVHLLPYGDFVCGNACKYPSPVEFNPVTDDFPSPLADALQAYGGAVFSGRPLTPMYPADDGNQEQVFANLVVYASPDDLATIHFRPVPMLLENLSSDLVRQTLGPEENMHFVALQDDLGHHVPIPFQMYVDQHGGADVFGAPISELTFESARRVYQQCFEKMCLQYFPQAADAYKTLPMPLGQRYLLKFRPVAPGGALRAEDVLMVAHEGSPKIKSGDHQTISIQLLQLYSGQAISGYMPVIIVRNDRGEVLFEGVLPKTDDGGNSSITLDPLPVQQNGDLLLYQVCIIENTNAPICVNGSYLIWDR